jgi:YVTN family beta-propeller protein
MPRVKTTRAIGEQPKAVAASADGVYTALFASNRLVRTNHDASALLWQAATGPGGANGVAVGANVAIVTNRDRSSVTLLDARTGAALAELPVGGLPWGVAAAADRAYVANFGANSVSVIDLTARQVLATTPVLAYPVAAVADAGGAYIVHLDGYVTRLDTQGRLLAQIDAGAPDARGIAQDVLRGRVYVGSREGFINALDAQTLQPAGRIDLPGPAYGLTVNPATGRLYAVDAANNRLYVIEPDGSPFVSLSLPPQDAQQGGMGIAAWDNRIFVANYAAGSLTLVDDTSCAGRLTPTPAPPTPTAPALALADTARAMIATATAPTEGHLRIGNLGATRVPMGRNWKAIVSITSLDGAGRPAANAVVSGTWSGGFVGSGTCVTDAAGQCSVESGTLPGEVSTTFTLQDVSLPGHTYQPEANTDPDGDSDGASIIVLGAGASGTSRDTGQACGLVWEDHNRDGMYEAGDGDLPLAGVTVALSQGTALTAVATTDASGRFRFAGLTPGDYTIEVTDAHGILAGYGPTRLGPAPRQDNNNQEQPYAVRVEASAEDLTADFGYSRSSL